MVTPISITAFEMAQRFVGIKEIPGPDNNNDQILKMLKLDDPGQSCDEVPWCSAFVNYIAWLLRLPRSKSLSARSWLTIGFSVELADAEVGFDVVVLKRNGDNQPGPEVLAANGHVGFFAGTEGNQILVLGGNQSNSVNVSPYPKSRLLGIRRLRLAYP